MLTHVAWAKKATANFGAESRMVSKRESEPEDEMRVKRWVPTALGVTGEISDQERKTAGCGFWATDHESYDLVLRNVRHEDRSAKRTARGPHSHGRTQCHLSPVPCGCCFPLSHQRRA